jgi:uncharacterized delta-60 repeat protein
VSSAWRLHVGCLVAVALSLGAMPSADAATVRLDTTFGDSGIARVPFRVAGSRTLVRPLRPVRQPDGKVLVAAAIEGDRGDPMQVALARFKRTGQPDRTFGRGGRVRLGARWNFDPRAVVVQPDGRIVLMGAAGHGINSLYPLVAPGQLGLVRLLPNGSRDRTFGTNGFVIWNPPWRGDTVLLQTIPGLLVRQADGRLLIPLFVDELRAISPGGNVGFWRVAFVRFNENGSVDESFGRAGVVEGLDGPDYVFHWVALPDGDLAALASRPEGFGNPYSWRLHRFTADGALDLEFGQDGSVRLGLKDLYDVGELVPMRDGGLVIVRATALRRIGPTGQLDGRFGTTCGRLPVRASENVGAAATSDGGVLATVNAYAPRTDSFIVRYGSDGCATARPLRLGSLSAGPPLLQGRHTAMVGATDDGGLALIRVRR